MMRERIHGAYVLTGSKVKKTRDKYNRSFGTIVKGGRRLKVGCKLWLLSSAYQSNEASQIQYCNIETLHLY